ncbi:MAG: c-type cytochrome domain-containing protein, partial [Planctomycetaceae bacterium]
MGRILFAGLVAVWSTALAAAEPPSPTAPAEKTAATVDVYVKHVKPLLSKRCVACHGHLKQESGLRVDAVRHLLKGGDRGPAVVAGDPEKSVLIEAITGKNDLQMPPEGEPITKDEVALVRKWIADGAHGPSEEKVMESPREHWSFQKPVRAALPAPKNASWVRNPIDAFVAARHDAHNLTPVAAAPRNLLLRRVTLDLTGLPPSPEELRAFVA